MKTLIIAATLALAGCAYTEADQRAEGQGICTEAAKGDFVSMKRKQIDTYIWTCSNGVVTWGALSVRG